MVLDGDLARFHRAGAALNDIFSAILGTDCLAARIAGSMHKKPMQSSQNLIFIQRWGCLIQCQDTATTKSAVSFDVQTDFVTPSNKDRAYWVAAPNQAVQCRCLGFCLSLGTSEQESQGSGDGLVQ